MTSPKTRAFVGAIVDGHICSPAGFRAAGVCAGLKTSGKPDMALLVSERPAAAAGMFTTCRFAAAPVRQCQARLAAAQPMRAVIVNSGNANACTGKPGDRDALRMAELAAAALGILPEEVFVSSTGRIGVPMPMDKIGRGIELAAAALSPDNGPAAARAIMTTDTRPKEGAIRLAASGHDITLGGMTKGAGMIAPRLDTPPHATMLTYLTTDAAVAPAFLQECLAEAVEETFNCITIDGDTSTNDTVLLLANGAAGNPPLTASSPEAPVFRAALHALCAHLAREIVRDGEGVTRFVTVQVEGAATAEDARRIARAVAESLLCKTAWFGGDPNWGRVLAAAGRAGVDFDPAIVDLFYDDLPVVRQGGDAGTPEAKLAEIVAKPEFTVRLDLHAGDHEGHFWTNDISYEYVKINADYRT
jgi:glutamate N-acetyltransferase/amino-acid N-acetyltransferase